MPVFYGRTYGFRVEFNISFIFQNMNKKEIEKCFEALYLYKVGCNPLRFIKKQNDTYRFPSEVSI